MQDLLAPRRGAVKLRGGTPDKGDLFTGCSEIPVCDEADLADALARGHARRAAAAASANAGKSPRASWKTHLPASHGVFIVHVTQHGAAPPAHLPPLDAPSRCEYMYRAQLYFIDLAHSATLRGRRGGAADKLAALREAAAPPDAGKQVNVRHTETGLAMLSRAVDAAASGSVDEAPFGYAIAGTCAIVVTSPAAPLLRRRPRASSGCARRSRTFVRCLQGSPAHAPAAPRARRQLRHRRLCLCLHRAAAERP